MSPYHGTAEAIHGHAYNVGHGVVKNVSIPGSTLMKKYKKPQQLEFYVLERKMVKQT
jgi:hypothetical protein